MSLVGLDLNSSRARAVNGPLGDYPLAMPLCVSGEELPLILSLEARQVEVGAAGERLRRRLPHLTCHSFLPHLGEERRWKAGRHNLDSLHAVEQVWRHLAKHVTKGDTLVLCLPPYLTGGQADQVRGLAEKAGVKALGSLPSTLAAALAGYADDRWVGSALVLDIDEHALSAALVEAADHKAYLRETVSWPQLGWRVWRERLIDALADCCVLQSRRDPRDSSLAEQGLYEQLAFLLDAHAQNRLSQLAIQGANWFQNLVVAPEETAAFCQSLVGAVVHELHALLASLHPERLPHALLLTAEADRLPGLTPALAHLIEPFRVEVNGTNGYHRPPSEDDFGANLLRDSGEDRWHVVPLGKNACAQAAHSLAGFFQKGDLPPGHLETCAPLPLSWPIEAGPARLSFQGKDYFLDGSTFLIGTQADCHLHVDPGQYAGVAGRHCEVFFDHRTYVLFNRSSDGTWVNDAAVVASVVLHPGDRIRLGMGGPVIKFLGQATR